MITAKQCAAKEIETLRSNGFEVSQNQEVFADLKAATVSMEHIGNIIKKVEIAKDATFLMYSDNKEGGDVVVFRIKDSEVQYSVNVIPF